MDIKPGTLDYRQETKKRLVKVLSIFLVGIFVAAGSFAVAYYDIPKSDQAKILTSFIFLGGVVLSGMSILGSGILLLTAYCQTKLAKIRAD